MPHAPTCLACRAWVVQPTQNAAIHCRPAGPLDLRSVPLPHRLCAGGDGGVPVRAEGDASFLCLFSEGDPAMVVPWAAVAWSRPRVARISCRATI